MGIYYLYAHLNFAQRKIESANHTISLKDRVIDEKNDRISIIRDSICSLERLFDEEQNRRLDAEGELAKVYAFNPFVVTSCSVDANKFSFDYYAIEQKDLTVTLKAINEKNSQIISNSYTLTFYKGGGTKELDFAYGLDAACYYNIVLMCDGKIVAGKRW